MDLPTHTQFDDAVYQHRRAELALVDDLKRQKTGLLTSEPDLDIVDAESDYETIEDCLNDFIRDLYTPDRAKPPAKIVRAPTGLGKTYGTIRRVANGKRTGEISGTVLHVVADLKNMYEAEGFYKKFGVTPTLLKGMVSSGCIKAEEVEDRYQAGLSARSLCKFKDENGETHFCPLYNTCNYVQTRRKILDTEHVDVLICTAEYLRSGGIPKEIQPDLIVVDENFSDKLIYESYIKLDDFGLGWTVDQKSRASNRLAKLSKQIVVLAVERKPVVDALIAKYDEIEELHRELKAIISQRNREKMSIAKGEVKQNSAVKQNVMRNEMMIWESILDEVAHRVEHGCDSRGLGVFHVIREVDADGGERLDISKRKPFPYPTVPVIGLDATADDGIYKGVMSDTHEVSVVSIAGRPNNLFITAILGQSFSSSSLVYHKEGSYEADGRTRNPKEETERRRQVASVCLERILEKEAGRKVLICCTQANKDVLLQDMEISAELRRRVEAEDVAVRHFGTLKGLNEFQDYDTIIIFGKLEARDETVTRLARGFCEHDEAVSLTGAKTHRKSIARTLYTYSNQSAQMRTHVYEDKQMRALQGQIREQEIIQSMGRLRSVNRPMEDLRAYLLTDAVPEGLILDNVFHVDDITKTEPSPLEALAVKSGGIVSAAGYQTSENVSHQAAQQFLKRGGFAKDACPEGWTLVKASIKGRRGAPMKLYVPTHTLAAWEADSSLEVRIKEHMLTCGKLDDIGDKITLQTNR